jgi:phosphoglycolate phosphatase
VSPAVRSSILSAGRVYSFVERPFWVVEAKSAREAFLWSIGVSPAGRQDRWHRGGAIVHPKAAGNLFGARGISEMTLTAASSHRISRPRAILFDWDNTLVDSWSTIHEALNFLMAAMDKPLWTIEETRERVRLSLREAFPRIFGERWEEARDIYLDRFRAIHLESLTALPGRTELLQRLADEEIFLGVVSNKTGSLLRRETDHIGWAALFGSVVGAGDAPLDKPDAAPVRLALEQSGIDPGETVWFVGDTGIDMECAHNSGCVPVLLGSGMTQEEFGGCPPRFVFSDCLTLFRFVQGL